MKKTIYRVGKAKLSWNEKDRIWYLSFYEGGIITLLKEKEISDVGNVCFEMLTDWKKMPKGKVRKGIAK